MRKQLILLVLLTMVMVSCKKAPEKIKKIVKGKSTIDVLVLIDATSSSTRFIKDYQGGK